MQLAVVLIMVKMEAPGTAVIVAGQDRRIPPVGAISPELQRQRAVARFANVQARCCWCAHRIVRSIEAEAHRYLGVNERCSVEHSRRLPVDYVGSVTVSWPPGGQPGRTFNLAEGTYPHLHRVRPFVETVVRQDFQDINAGRAELRRRDDG